jgi:integrase
VIGPHDIIGFLKAAGPDAAKGLSDDGLGDHDRFNEAAVSARQRLKLLAFALSSPEGKGEQVLIQRGRPMPKLLTSLTVKQMKPLKSRNGQLQRREIADAGEKNLYLHVQPSGAKSWVLMVTRPNGKLGKLVLGSVDLSGRESSNETPVIGTPLTLADARWLAAEMKKQRKTGKDIVIADRDRKAKSKTAQPDDTKFFSVAKQFVDEYARPQTRRWQETARMLGLDYKDVDNPVRFAGGLADRWQDKDITTITSDDVYRIIDETKRRGVPGLPCRTKGISNSRGRAMARTLSRFFSWCLEHRKIKANPSVGVYCPPAPSARKRPLSKDEVIRFWRATDQMNGPNGAMLKLLLLTGGRLREVAGMRRSELSEHVVTLAEDDKGNPMLTREVLMWTLPPARTKNKLEHQVPLPPLAREIIASVKVIAGRPGYVFSFTGRTPVAAFSKTKKRLDDLMRAEGSDDFLSWRLHDLRKTFSTMMHDSPPKGLRIPPHVVEALINHISGHKSSVAGIYNAADYAAEKTVALERWSSFIQGMVAGRSGATIVPMRKGKG